MKRKKSVDLDVQKTWSLFFWRECKKCKMQFRREWGWKKFFLPIMRNRAGDWDYVCLECCPTIKKAYEELMKRWKPTRPPGQIPKPQLPPITVVKEGETRPLNT